MNTKTQSKHTAGPWHIGVRQPSSDKFIYGSKGEEVADCDRLNNFPDENLANARLISTAPELLEALKREKAANDALLQVLRDAYERFTDNDMQPANHSLKVWLSKARVCFDHAESKDTQAAIAKAEGKL